MKTSPCVMDIAAPGQCLFAALADNDTREAARRSGQTSLAATNWTDFAAGYFAAGFAGSLAAASLASGFASLAFASLAALGSLAGMKSNLPFW